MSTLGAEDLRVTLGGREVLHRVTAAFARRTVTAIVGPNGAGKSTLLGALAGLIAPQSGYVHLDGRALMTISARTRAKRIALLPQTPEIAWAVDGETLVGLGRLPHLGWLAGGLGVADRDAVERAMKATGVATFGRRPVTTLSGGERARVLLARALAGEPDWLLADEPLAGLDPGHQLDASALLRRIAADGAGVVVTLHDLALAAHLADRVLVLAEGRVVADAAPEAALTPEMLAQVYGVTARVERRPEGLAIALTGRVTPHA